MCHGQRGNQQQSWDLSPGSLALGGPPEPHTTPPFTRKGALGTCLQRDGNFSLLPAWSAFLEVALRLSKEGFWVKMMEGEDNVDVTAVGMLREAGVRRRPPGPGTMFGS